MGAKSKYVLVQIASVVSGATKVWARNRASEKVAVKLFDPAIGRETIFEEIDTIKSKQKLTPYVIKKFNVDETASI